MAVVKQGQRLILPPLIAYSLSKLIYKKKNRRQYKSYYPGWYGSSQKIHYNWPLGLYNISKWRRPLPRKKNPGPAANNMELPNIKNRVAKQINTPPITKGPQKQKCKFFEGRFLKIKRFQQGGAGAGAARAGGGRRPRAWWAADAAPRRWRGAPGRRGEWRRGGGGRARGARRRRRWSEGRVGAAAAAPELQARHDRWGARAEGRRAGAADAPSVRGGVRASSARST